MKLFVFTILFIFAAGLLATPAFAQTRPPESSDKAVGCDCSKDDVGEIRQAHQSILLPVSMLLASPGAGNTELGRVLRIVNDRISECVEYAIQILGQFKCGGCVDTASGFSNDLFTYDCCCDSDAIKDHVKDTINAIALAVPQALSVGGETGRTMLLALIGKYKTALTLAIDGIIDDYADVTPPPSVDLLITGIVDGPITGGFPKAVEIFALKDISMAELARYELAIVFNGGGLPFNRQVLINPGGSLSAGQFYYISQAAGADEFSDFFDFDPDQNSGVAQHNGNDSFFILKDGIIVDQLGFPDVNGEGETWESKDGWAYRLSGARPDQNGFVEANWDFEKGIWRTTVSHNPATNDAANTPFPIGTYKPF